MGTVTIPGF